MPLQSNHRGGGLDYTELRMGGIGGRYAYLAGTDAGESVCDLGGVIGMMNGEGWIFICRLR